jgi:hypothetical protein
MEVWPQKRVCDLCLTTWFHTDTADSATNPHTAQNWGIDEPVIVSNDFGFEVRPRKMDRKS